MVSGCSESIDIVFSVIDMTGAVANDPLRPLSGDGKGDRIETAVNSMNQMPGSETPWRGPEEAAIFLNEPGKRAFPLWEWADQTSELRSAGG